MPNIKINKYKRKVNGKYYIVKRHSRIKRKSGTKRKYTKIGTFYVAHDQYGNFKGSKVVAGKSVGRRSRRARPIGLGTPKSAEDINTDYYLGKISYSNWKRQRQQ